MRDTLLVMQTSTKQFTNIEIQSSIGFLAGRVAHKLRTEINEFLVSSNISLSSEEFIFLTALEEMKTPKRMGELAIFLKRDASTIKRQLNRLVEQNLVLREPCPDDNRAVVISINHKGKTLVKKTYPKLVNLRKKALDGIPAADQEVLIKSLTQVLSNLDSPSESY